MIRSPHLRDRTRPTIGLVQKACRTSKLKAHMTTMLQKSAAIATSSPWSDCLRIAVSIPALQALNRATPRAALRDPLDRHRRAQISDSGRTGFGLSTDRTTDPPCHSRDHFEVYPSLSAATSPSNMTATSQIAPAREASDQVYASPGYEASVTNLSRVTISSDRVFSDGAALELATMTGSVSQGFTATPAKGV